MEKNDKKPKNPSAFPNKEIDWNASQIQQRTVYFDEEKGMTLRDYFAAQAMQGILSGIYSLNEKVSVEHFTDVFENVSKNSYWFANKMLEQRQK